MKQLKTIQFVEENLKTIFAYALSRVSNKDEAEDLTNDIVLAILQSADKLKNPDAFYGYVWGIAANTYRKFIRKKCHFSFEEIDDTLADSFDFTETILLQEDISNLRREIALLSKEYRECTIAYYYDELSCTEISNKLNISLEMVKYYLFKTRKILKEGICMEREFGEKSFNPVPFTFNTIFSGNCNWAYHNLFSRKLPGQILISTYYTPMNTRELAIELGVASVYLEDEIAMLETHNLITKLPTGKYQTNLVIFTNDFKNEFYRKAQKFTIPALSEILLHVKEKLNQIRMINSFCEKLSDTQLLWETLWPIIHQGYFNSFAKEYPEFQKRDKLYDGATGTNYGISYDTHNTDFECLAFAGYSGIDENYYVSGVDFGVLPKTNHYFDDETRFLIKEKIYKTLSNEMEPEFMILTEADEQKLFQLLSPEISFMRTLYRELFTCSCQLMYIHAPKSICSQVDRIVFQTLFFETVGFIGGCALKSKMLPLPDFNTPAAIYVRENTKKAEATISENVLF